MISTLGDIELCVESVLGICYFNAKFCKVFMLNCCLQQAVDKENLLLQHETSMQSI